MDNWQPLENPIYDGLNTYWMLPPAEHRGELWIRLPAVAVPEFVSLALGADDAPRPTRLKLEVIELQTYAQVVRFDYPPFLQRPFIGVEFLEENQVLNILCLLVLDDAKACCLAVLSQLETLKNQIASINCEETMAFYNNRLEELEQDINVELDKRLETVDELPNPQGHTQGDQYHYSVTGETITLATGNRWLGDIQEQDWSAIAPGLDGLQANGSAVLDAREFFDFNGGPERFIEELLLSNSSDKTANFDLLVPAHDPANGVFAELGIRDSMTLEIGKYNTQLSSPDIKLAAADQALRVSLLVRYRNVYNFVAQEQEQEVSVEGDQPQAAG